MSINARGDAFQILLTVEQGNAHAEELLHGELARTPLGDADRNLLTELVYGTLRKQGTLDYIINLFSKQKSTKLERKVLILLRLGLYQLFFLERIPPSAAVNETVKLAKHFAPRAAGFINAILRTADRQRDSITYPDAERDPVNHLATKYSHPAWLIEEWMGQLGSFHEAESLAQIMSEQAPITVRANTLRTNRNEMMHQLEREGASCRAARFSPDGIRITSSLRPAESRSFSEGLFFVQDESSQLAARLLAPQKGETILDACAAPGGKTTCIAQLMANTGKIFACDISERKLLLIKENIQRLGTSNIETSVADAAKPLPLPLADMRFDRILLDAPCTGLGVLRRHPEAKWRKTPEDPIRLAEAQKNMLLNLAHYLKPGGTFLYSTCSTSRIEDEEVVDYFLSQRQDFVIEDLRNHFPELRELFSDRGFFRSWPHRHDGMDGFFAARLRKAT